MKIVAFSLTLAVGASFLPTSLVDPVARAMVPAIALMATGIFPCMTLAIGAMKAEGRTPALIEDLYGQLRGLLQVLVVTFALAVSEIIALTASIALSNPTAWQGFTHYPGTFHLTPAQVAVMVSAAILGILGGRVVALGRAFFAVLDINKKQALLVARAKVRTERDASLDLTRRARFPADDPAPRRLQAVNAEK